MIIRRITYFFKQLIGTKRTKTIVNTPDSVDIVYHMPIKKTNTTKQNIKPKKTKIAKKESNRDKQLKASAPVGTNHMGMEVKTSLTIIKKVDVENNDMNVSCLSNQERSARDITYMMEVPFLALSKRRKEPIVYEKTYGQNTIKVKVTRHSEHFLASIHDWDIVLFIAGKIQKILNEGSDIPPRKIVFGRQEILKALHKHDGKKEEKDLVAALFRLQSTMIETNIRNEDGKYGSVFSFIESWSYTDRKDIREIRVTISDWLYEGICEKGSLLMVDSQYFEITSGLKKWLYRTARKHAGNDGKSWEFLTTSLHERSGSEMEMKCFKRDLKSAVSDNDLPGYSLEWKEKNKRTSVVFKSDKKKKIAKLEEVY